jgi:hypothetical protein
VVLGVVIAAVVRGSAPQPPTPGLCWYWSDSYQENGYWDRCGAYWGVAPRFRGVISAKGDSNSRGTLSD